MIQISTSPALSPVQHEVEARQKKADKAWDDANAAHFKKDFGQEQIHTLEALEHQRQVRELLK